MSENVQFILFMSIFVFFVLLVFLIGFASTHWDTIAVFIIKRFSLNVYPAAVGIASELERDIDSWKLDGASLTNKSGSLRLHGFNVHTLTVYTPYGEWCPNKIEKQIIWDMINYRRTTYIKKNVMKDLITDRRASAIKIGKITDVPSE